MKVSPKSCSCQQCMRGKHTKAGHYMMKCDERANRHAVKCELDKLRGKEYNLCWIDELNIPTVPIGNYYD